VPGDARLFGASIDSAFTRLRVKSHEATELEFHMSFLNSRGLRRGKSGGELFAAGDVELAKRVGEVAFDGLGRNEQHLCDLAIGGAAGRSLRDAPLGGCEGVAAGLCVASRACACEYQFLACSGGERSRTACVREIQGLTERSA